MQADQQARGLVGEALLRVRSAGGAQLRRGSLRAARRARRDRDLLGGAGELVEDVLQAAAIVGQSRLCGHGQGVAGGIAA